MAVELHITPRAPIHLSDTLRFQTGAPRDPAFRLEPDAAWVALGTSAGPATLHYRTDGDGLIAAAWGPGAAKALAGAAAAVGAEDDPSGFRPDHPVLRRLSRRHRGLRITKSGRVAEMAMRTAVGQVVTGKEAKRSWTRLAHAIGEPAPGPVELLLPPDARTLASMPYEDFHRFGIEKRRADILRRIARHARRLDEATAMPLDDAVKRLRAVPGIGPWTAAKVRLTALGDPDAVPTGDFHLPNTVAWLLAGEERADDNRMLELLAPYAGHRGRVIRLVQASGVHAPRRGPRAPLRSIEHR
jgi:3-methyladenine DNA glycosylase/8-oxoguanine DNA glycosylase